MASTSSPSREEASFATPAPVGEGDQVPGMGQYRLPMDMNMSTLDSHFGQPNMGGESRLSSGTMSGPHQRPHQPQHGQFGILTPTPVPHLPMHPHQHHANQNMMFSGHGMDMSAVQQSGTAGQDVAPAGHGNGLEGRVVLDPPDLEAWRQKLFDVDDTIILTNDQYQTYFPHVDNVYSHRSTQRYKRKPFISHYWDCRMKGRPAGTPKSDDPNKKKRKRVARERDLCDVKIKITEYFPGSQVPLENHDPSAALPGFVDGSLDVVGPGQKFWTIQRVNGNGGNGKGDGVAGPHKHTLDRSDEIKKSSIQRLLAKQDKETKKLQKPINRKASGAALATIKRRAKDAEFQLLATCFCPFSQRVWIALEAKGISYQYCETDAYKTPVPANLLEANPKGLVPVIRQDDWALADSAVILEYLEDLGGDVPLLPGDARLKASCRLWIDHINTSIVPAFYAILRHAGSVPPPAGLLDRLHSAMSELVRAADEQGPYFLGESMSLVDIHLAPFAMRLKYLGLLPTGSDARLHTWLESLESNKHIAATVSGPELYKETVTILADHRPLGMFKVD